MNSNGRVKLRMSERGEFQRIVMHAFRLRPAIRKVFLLCDVRGFTIAETAAVLGISPTVVNLRLDWARREMNVRLHGRK
jgi:DNA-directed RNA polymerase specialized sigma24 family protein